MSERIDLAGKRFGRLVVEGYAGRQKNRQSRWTCLCDCGKRKVIVRSSLTSGHSNSCGCLRNKSNGEANNYKKRSPEYIAWTGIIARCEDKTNPNYGGRGITICPEWRHDYPAFLAHVGRRPSQKHSIDRIDNNGSYEPGNVRWATAKMQVANRRAFQFKSWRQSAKHAYEVVRTFERVLASYTGAPYAVTVDSCTDALLLACAHLRVDEVEIPRRTYCGVPMSIIHAGGRVKFRDESWVGMYKLDPYPIYDSARLFTSGMYVPGSLMCLSFHWSKHLAIGRGGAILCEDIKTAEWLKRARFDGRKEGVDPKNDKEMIIGWHTYLTPDRAAQGLMLMASMAEHNKPLPNSDYPDLSLMECFK